MYRYLTPFVLLPIAILSGCSSIDINNVELDKLEAKVNVTQSSRSTSMDLFLSRGIWHQAVTSDENRIEAEMADGRLEPLIKARKKGRYGFRLQNGIPIRNLTIEQIGHIDLPTMTPVVLRGRDQFEGRSFFKDDVLRLALRETQSDKRYLVVTGYCGNQPYTAEQQISSNDVELELPLSRLMNMVNKSAEADLNGIIPMTLAVEERYSPVWPAPFVAGKIAAHDETQFTIDTSGFRFKASLSVNVAENVFFTFQNQQWDVKYCF